MFLEISQNSQENTCATVSLLIKLQAMRTPFSQNASGRLLLNSKKVPQMIKWYFVEITEISKQARHKFCFAFSVKIDDKYFHLIFSWFITYLVELWICRQRRGSVRKGVLRNLAKFTSKHRCQSPFVRSWI